MAAYLGLSAIGWQAMLAHWWDWTIAVFALVSVSLGALYVSFLLYRYTRRCWKGRKDCLSKTNPAGIAHFLAGLPSDLCLLLPQSRSPKPPTSFGVFLGHFSDPLRDCRSLNQTKLLSRWDLIVLDPCQPGVLEAAAESSSAHVLGRLDLSRLECTSSSTVVKYDPVELLREIILGLTTGFKHRTEATSPFTGVLLAGWEAHVPPAVLNPLLQWLDRLNVDVYLEIGPPEFLTPDQCLTLDLGSVKGLVCRNVTILGDGDRRDYYGMTEMRRAQRALAREAWRGGKSFMMLETVHDDVELSYSVLKRSFNWARFNSALSWIGPESALTNVDAAAARAVSGEPLGALMWLKSSEVMAVHEVWRKNGRVSATSVDHMEVFESLECIVPGLSQRLTVLPACRKEASDDHDLVTMSADFDWSSVAPRPRFDPLTFSALGESYTGLGCFQIGLQCNSTDFDGLVEGQRRLRNLNLLDTIKPDESRRMAATLRKMYCSEDLAAPIRSAVNELLDLLEDVEGDLKSHRLRVYVGMHSGFHSGVDNQFFGLFGVDGVARTTDVFLSAKTTDRTSTLLHTFLSSRQFSRDACFQAECALARQTDSMIEGWSLPRRLVQDIENLTPRENILLLQRLPRSADVADDSLGVKLAACCRYQLLEAPSLEILRRQRTEEYLRGKASAEDLIEARITWLREQGVPVPAADAALSVFNELDARLPLTLLRREAQTLDKLTKALQILLQKDSIDASADILALSVFSAFRKLAVDEVYLEVLDRNPLPNSHEDQAACFAEMFALGSQCEAYLDTTPQVVGRILADRYWAYYHKNQPPRRDDKATEMPSAYASMNTAEDPSARTEALPLYYQFTFLGLFAVPALIDILLLTVVGRGLYLSTYMNEIEKTMATAGLMVGLLLVGAIGTWIGHGGSYYLHCMAFPAMNMFVLTRTIAGYALCLTIGIGALIVLGCIKGFYAGFIFFFYFATMSTYLTMLATLAIYQFPGFMFQSGRVVVVKRIPILFVSPIVTVWAGHDIIVYPVVLVVFLVTLIFGLRSVLAKWHSWYLKVHVVTDSELVDWFQKANSADGDLPKGITDLAATPLPRQALVAELTTERERRLWTKSTADEFVKKVAKGHDATLLLMDWYCKYSRTKMPYPYSPTWNLMIKAAVDTLKDIQKGLKLHNAFIHWRQGGDEVWCGMLYFVVALMDKWVALLTGGALVGLSDADSQQYRLAVGFGLSYYLLSAVCLDAVAGPLWAIANKKTATPIGSKDCLHRVAEIDAKARRRLYWVNFARYFFMHVWGAGVMSALLWTFEDGRNAIIMFLAYVGAYCGLLWYQYNRIYTGALAMRDLITGAICGFVLGLVLRSLTTLQFSGLIGLAVATWTTALMSMWTARIGRPRPTAREPADEKQEVFYASGSLRQDTVYSQATLSGIFKEAIRVPEEERLSVIPSSQPGAAAMQVLATASRATLPDTIQTAFPLGRQFAEEVATLWREGKTVIELVPARLVLDQGATIAAVSRDSGHILHILVLIGHQQVSDINQTSQTVAEVLMQVTAQARFALSYDYSVLAQLLLVPHAAGESLLPLGLRRLVKSSAIERTKTIGSGERTVLRYLLLGFDADTEWDPLPGYIRSFLVKRCCAERCVVDSKQLDWIRCRFRSTRTSDVERKLVPWSDESPCQEWSSSDSHDDNAEKLDWRGSDLIFVEQHVARCNLGVQFSVMLHHYARKVQADLDEQGQSTTNVLCDDMFVGVRNERPLDQSRAPLHEKLLRPALRTVQGLRLAIKFLVISTVADPEMQRELEYVVGNNYLLLRLVAKVALLGIWNFCKTLQRCIIPWYLFHDREKVHSLYREMQGTEVTMRRKGVTVEGMLGPLTGFFESLTHDGFTFHLYSGRHKAEPAGQAQLKSVHTYSRKLLLQRREEYSNETVSNVFDYEYAQQTGRLEPRIPIQRHCIQGPRQGDVVQYDERGYICSGSYLKDGNFVEFNFEYRKNARFDDELLRATFRLAHISMSVAWCVPPESRPEKLNRWLPYTKVTEATFTEGTDVYHSKWTYDHRSHPTIDTTLNGQPMDTPAMIEHDWFSILKKPTNYSFLSENPLLSFKEAGTTIASRTLRMNRSRYAVSTSLARTHLWRRWKESKDLDAVTARWLDETRLRSERILRPYWTRRDCGLLRSAAEYLERNADAVLARADVDPDVSAWCSLAYKYSDLAAFGQGGDSKINTRAQKTQMRDRDDVLHVLAHDTGTWPNEGGGVSACRRDMVNNLNTIRWHVIAENANDFGIPKFQTERNVQSLSILPLWGLDFLTPTHGVFQDYLDSAIQRRLHNTTDSDIRRNFLPILTSLVRCARAIKFDHSHIQEASQALLDLNSYFAGERHWGHIWSSDIVKEKWRDLWLSEDITNARPISEWLQAEHPTLLHMDTALDMWHRYLFIFSLPLPERIPDVFQASHHFAGASYGVLCKLKRNCTLHVWDHCISWRENPGWEVEHGTQEGVLQHRRAFARKIDPVVNGICNMENFKPIETIKSKLPTVVMLSHVRFVKDIKNAILAADVIVNEWGFTDYRLNIYGDMEKAPAYSVECKEILASKGLRDHVVLKGLGSPSKVLEEAWLFLNSSVSEGLPLAMGEAALTGAPVVCTDVGASFRVVTDPVTGKKFSAVVAPNDAVSLAGAQINVLALLDEWSEFADDKEGEGADLHVPKLSLQPTPEEVNWVTQRMYQKTPQRRRLGMLGRANVLSSFSEERYLREHEQMLWIGKQQSPSYTARSLRSVGRTVTPVAVTYPQASLMTPFPIPRTYVRHLRPESPSPRYTAINSSSTSVVPML